MASGFQPEITLCLPAGEALGLAGQVAEGGPDGAQACEQQRGIDGFVLRRALLPLDLRIIAAVEAEAWQGVVVMVVERK